MSCPAKQAVVAYVASPHDGYLQLFRRYAGSDLFVFGEDIIRSVSELTRHLPGNRPEDAVAMIDSLGIFDQVQTLTYDTVGKLASYQRIIMPDEQIARTFAAQHLEGYDVTFDSSWRLRWDWGASTKQNLVVDDVTVTNDELSRQLMAEAFAEAARSPDWWRQIGGILVRDGVKLLAAFNEHLPGEQSAYLEGDPRSCFEPGICIDTSLAIHAEVSLITEAARRGIRTEGCDLYVTTFPCPPCAYATAKSGIRRLYYRDGYSLVAGADALRAKKVEIIRVI